ncbi:MAG TPA: nucleotidyltransferase [Pyrinomonadaceae bacterium]|nr:nucleotidyltransferase [Pyrinomonadaceae bacterium]
MANVQKYFEEFHKRIRVDYEMSSTLRDKRDKILNRVRKYLSDNGLPGFTEILQGSYKMKTGTIPIANLEYDIDVGLRFSIKATDYDAKTVRQWVFKAVDGHTQKVEEKGPCIRVTYADGYHVDLVIYACWQDDLGQNQCRLAHKTNGWREADPIGLIDHVKAARKPYEGTEDKATQTDQFRRVVRYQRRWIDEEIPFVSSSKPTGLAFVLLSIAKLRPTLSWMGLPDDRAALEALAKEVSLTIGRIVAKKPTPEYEDMFGCLSDEEMDSLKVRYDVMAKALREADEVTDPVEACEVLEKIFGDDFPIPEAEETAKKTYAPAIVTSSSSG